ncbi:hypothetical protein [Paenibacillus sp. 1_12]|uniref:hypothetical protein n=1 Tax=Paenibacillus sp. 1_12 TaxID=1566278 RepID=UPI000B8723FF|nr:hypothetical protein [Paenibacillus sp. 1_12]
MQNMITYQSLLQSMNNLQPQDIQELLTPHSLRSAGIMVMFVPLLVVCPFLQKYFVKCVLIGTVKG